MRIFQPGSYINVDFANKKVMTIELQDELMESGMPKQHVEVNAFTDGDALRSEIEHFIVTGAHPDATFCFRPGRAAGAGCGPPGDGTDQGASKTEAFKPYFKTN